MKKAGRHKRHSLSFPLQLAFALSITTVLSNHTDGAQRLCSRGLPLYLTYIGFKPLIMASDKSTSRRTVEDDESRPYIIVSDIGKGSFATVYKGYHEVCARFFFYLAFGNNMALAGNSPPGRHQVCATRYTHCKTI